jgi:hypothetical protein
MMGLARIFQVIEIFIGFVSKFYQQWPLHSCNKSEAMPRGKSLSKTKSVMLDFR